MYTRAFSTTAVLCLTLLLSAKPAALGAEANKEKQWNDLNLLSWVSGIGGEKSTYDKLDSVKRFEILQQAIEEVKQAVLHDAETEQEAIEGLRMVLKLLAMATDDTINNDFKNPLFVKMDTRFRDIGAYNPDAEYDQAFIDGRYDYRLSGNLGTVPYASITVNGTADGERSRLIAHMSYAKLKEYADDNGNFTLWLTKEKPQGNGAWIKLPTHANGVVIRQYIGNRDTDTLATFSIQAVGENLPDVERISDEEMALRFSRVTSFLLAGSTWHRTLLPGMKKNPNQFVPSSATAIGASAANAENYYQMAHYQKDTDEALILDFVAPKNVPYWNLTSATIWHESQHYLTAPVSLTMDEVVSESDGTVRFVVSDADPGFANWIQTFGHHRGFLMFRIPGATSHPLPKITKVKFEDLPKYVQ